MMGLITLIFLVLLIISCINYEEELMAVFGFFFAICLIITALLTGGIVNGRTLNEKIEMYTEENTKIEAQIDTLVKQYMDYESNTYGELKGESSITLVSLYPELKADALVTKELDLYVENNEKIKELKQKLINVSNYKWWVYFGK